MNERPNARVSMFAPAGTPRCETCFHLKSANDRHGGWCMHTSNRVVTNDWPQGFTPSQAWDGSCTQHPERLAYSVQAPGAGHHE